MGRLIGDGGWHSHVVDMQVLPPHPGRGLGAAVHARLRGEVRRRAPADAFVSLMADPPGWRLYERYGFTERRELSIGMAWWPRREER